MFYQVNKTTNQWIFHFILSNIHVPHTSDDYIWYNKSMYLLVLSAPEKRDLHVLRHNNGFLFSRGLLDNSLCLQVAAHPMYFFQVCCSSHLPLKVRILGMLSIWCTFTSMLPIQCTFTSMLPIRCTSDRDCQG